MIRLFLGALRPLARGMLWATVILCCGIRLLAAAEAKVLPGHVPPLISNLASIGRVPATNELRLAIGLPLRDPAGLEDFVARVSDPASPMFRQFLTREQLTERFGPTEKDYEAVKTFAQTNGLAIALTSANRLLLDVTGPAAAVEKAFHINLRVYRHPTEGREFFAPDSEPQVAVVLPVADVQGLSDLWRPHSQAARRPRSNAEEVMPNSGTAPDGSGNLFGNDFRNAYAPGVSLTGAGQSVGLMEFDAYYAADIFNYARAAGNGRTNIVIQAVWLDGYTGTPSSNNQEISMDIEMVMAIAPGLSKIVCFEGNPSRFVPNDVLNAMLASNIVNLSSSWSWNGGPKSTTDAIFKSMAGVGQSFFNASGDHQAYTSGGSSVHGVDNPSVYGTPCSNPYLTQVGGTTLAMTISGAAWSSESVWNWASEYSLTGVGSGGGVSSYYSPMPSWQTNVSNMAARGGSTGFRNLPDVAANADHVYVIDNNGNTNKGYVLGGTSAAAPLWAGFMALVNQQSAASGWNSAGFINPILYSIAAGTNYASCFHDVTSGNNTWSSSPALFYASNNYDLCTGLGTMNGSNLLNALAHSATTFSNLSASQSITYGATAITVAGKISSIVIGTNYPARGETVFVTINGNAQTTTINDATGDFSFSYNPSTIPFNATPYPITMAYAGDGSLNPATNTTTTLTVRPRPVSLTGSRTYDGTSAAASTILSVANALGSDAVTVASGSATLAGASVGSETITSLGSLTLGGAQAANYTLTSAGGSVTVLAKALTMGGLSVPSSKVYDGTATATVSGSPGALTGSESPGSGNSSDGEWYTGDAVSLSGTPHRHLR